MHVLISKWNRYCSPGSGARCGTSATSEPLLTQKFGWPCCALSSRSRDKRPPLQEFELRGRLSPVDSVTVNPRVQTLYWILDYRTPGREIQLKEWIPGGRNIYVKTIIC